MPTIQDILGFHFSPSVLKQSAQKVIPITLHTLNNHRIDKLHKIRDQVGASSFSFTETNLIPQVAKKFKRALAHRNFDLDKRELRTLTYALSYSEPNTTSIFSNENELGAALSLLDANWKDLYLIGLIDCFLQNWETRHQKSLEILEKYGAHKLDNYTGNRTALLSFKNNKRFFASKNGDLILGDTLAKLGKPIADATRVLGVPNTWIAYPYFSKVIVTYYEKNKSNSILIIDSLTQILGDHTQILTKRRLIPKIVIQATETSNLLLKEKGKRMALTYLKDPQNKRESLWDGQENLSFTERSELRIAKQQLLQWMAEEFIDFFFNKCINDVRRKRFWIKYAKQISLFKIVGSSFIKQLLLSDERIKKLVEARFASTNSAKDKNAALMFVIKDYLFVEFSDDGAFYAYKISNPNAPSIEAKSFNQTSDLKTPSMNRLAYRSGYYIERTFPEGKLAHDNGDLSWEEVANYWLQNIAGIHA